MRKIKNWEVIKNNSGEYNSIMDEINRNYTISKKLYFKKGQSFLGLKLFQMLSQTYKYDFLKLNQVTNKSIHCYRNNIRFKVKIEEYIPNTKISLNWSIGSNQYWSEYAIVEKKWYAYFFYSESTLQEKTISGLRGQIDIWSYKISFYRSFRKWKNYLTNKSEKLLLKIKKLEQENANLKKSGDISEKQKQKIMDKNEFKIKKLYSQTLILKPTTK